jgi:formamidopyrimidine-DNA glycosylase
MRMGCQSGRVPELPEVEALTVFLRQHLVGRFVTRVDLVAINALKTFDPPPTAVVGLEIESVERHGKWLDIGIGGLHLLIHLSRAGWVRWKDTVPTTPIRPGKGPLALRVVLDDGSGFDVTEAGTQKRLAVHLVRSLEEVERIGSLGPDPLEDSFTPEVLAGLLAARPRTQLKGVLRDQGVIAGIGNAYSDEILHAAQLSPFTPAGSLDDEARGRLYAAIRELLGEAVERSRGLPAGELKDDKRAAMRVHGRTGQACPVCGDVVREVSFSDRSLQYCATCQTGGKPLADRRMSRLLK